MFHLDSLSPDKSQLYMAEHMATHCVPIQRTSWQSTSAPSPARELHNVVAEFSVPDSLQQWQDLCQPDLPWAEEHFQERVSGQPLNPPPSFIRWPWHSAEEASKFLTENRRFDHTYPERYWPRDNLDEEQTRYGDLADEFLRLYPSSNMQESIYATTRDALYGWTSERLARAQAAIGQASYLYLFDHGYPAADAAGLHAFHASEIPYVFGTFDRAPPRWPSPPLHRERRT